MSLTTLFLGVAGVLIVSAAALLASVLVSIELAAAFERRRSPDPQPLDAAG